MPTVGVRCDADTATGVGHLVRCVALAEELLSRGLDVVFLGDLAGLPFVVRQLEARGLTWRPAPETPRALADLAVDLALDAVVLDGYDLHPGCGRALRDRGLPVLAIVDGGLRSRPVGRRSTSTRTSAPSGPRASTRPSRCCRGCGTCCCVMRCAGAARPRACTARALPTAGRRRGDHAVLAVFGGTDPYDAVLSVVPLLLATGTALDLQAIVSRTEVARSVSRLPLRPGQRLTLLSPVDDLPALVVESDLVVSASGSSVWELLCLGAPAATVCVTDNQEAGYRALVRRRPGCRPRVAHRPGGFGDGTPARRHHAHRAAAATRTPGTPSRHGAWPRSTAGDASAWPTPSALQIARRGHGHESGGRAPTLRSADVVPGHRPSTTPLPTHH